METDELSRRPHPLHFLWAALLALGFLGLAALILPRLHSTSLIPVQERSEPRQHVLVFVVDSTDRLEAHGEYVRSVIRHYCKPCEVRHVNVHGNMSTTRLWTALEHVREIVQGVERTTAVIINLSWGTYTYNDAIHHAIRDLDDLGAIIIASAGNDNTSKPFYPAAFDEVLGICSTSRYRNNKAAYSNFGPWVSLCAPGLHYVSRPLQHGGVASGTSFASPMVAGVLGQHLLDAPCATPQQGLQALIRTAEPFSEATQIAVAGRLNQDAAAHYLHALYACGAQPNWRDRILHAVHRISSNALLVMGLVLYALLSIFAFPFLLAYILECLQRRSEQRLHTDIQLVYAESSWDRSRRLERLKQRVHKSGRLRYRESVELIALLHAQYLYDEPCGWCAGQQRMVAEDMLLDLDSQSDREQLSVCARCGLKPEASTLSLYRQSYKQPDP